MHKEILTKEQVGFLPLVKSFSKDFGLVGGTAIALFLGHRRSVDFDLFSLEEFDTLKIRRKILKFHCKIEEVLSDEKGQYTIIISGVRFTFFHYPYQIKFTEKLEDIIELPNLLTLAALKAHALGRRAKWKDYVDLYFIMKNHYTLGRIVAKAKDIFSSEFNEKIFRAQLAYFKDIDYTEKVDYLEGFEIKEEDIKKKLIEFSLSR